MKKRLRILIPVLVVATALGTWMVLRGGGAEEGLIAASGTVEATEADLGFQLAGRIEEIRTREGDAVSGGEEIARLDTSELDAARDVAVAQVSAAEARLAELREGARPQEVAQAEAAVRSASRRDQEAREDAARAQKLFDGGAISQQALDKALTAHEVADASFEQAQKGLELVREGPRAETIRAQAAVVQQARAGLARTEAMLANAVVRAPFPGRVTVRHREPGETVSPGAPVVTLLDPEDRWVRIYMREDQVGAVRIGMPAHITSDTYPDKVYDGEVVFIGSQAEFTPRNVQTTEERIKLVYPVKVRITGDRDFELKPGIPADVRLDGTGA